MHCVWEGHWLCKIKERKRGHVLEPERGLRDDSSTPIITTHIRAHTPHTHTRARARAHTHRQTHVRAHARTYTHARTHTQTQNFSHIQVNHWKTKSERCHICQSAPKLDFANQVLNLNILCKFIKSLQNWIMNTWRKFIIMIVFEVNLLEKPYSFRIID